MYAWIRDTDVTSVIDVGSEEGDFTALYASWGCVVPFIDPSTLWVAQTYDIFLENELDPTPAFIGLADNRTDYEPFPVAEKRFATIDENIPRITLDTFVDWNDLRPDAITMDVEGSELRVLEGAEMLLTENIVWWISIHGEVDPHAATPSYIHEFMRARGFKDQWLGYQHEWFYRFWRS